MVRPQMSHDTGSWNGRSSFFTAAMLANEVSEPDVARNERCSDTEADHSARKHRHDPLRWASDQKRDERGGQADLERERWAVRAAEPDHGLAQQRPDGKRSRE